MELQIPYRVSIIYYNPLTSSATGNQKIKEWIELDATGKKHGQHLQYTEDGQLDIVHFYEHGVFICSL